jgi:hypothetical protein
MDDSTELTRAWPPAAPVHKGAGQGAGEGEGECGGPIFVLTDGRAAARRPDDCGGESSSAGSLGA